MKKTVNIIRGSKGLGVKALFLFSSLVAFQYSHASTEATAESTTTAQAQTTVTGRVTDAQGAPIAGVNVSVQGAAGNATITDVNGSYAIGAGAGATLEFRILGFETQQAAVANRSVVNVVMAEDTQSIDEVVVVGYGVVRKSDVTGSIATVKGSDLVKNQSFGVLDNLRGKAAGVSIFSNGGQPGMYAPRVIIRGSSSINASTDPLYVVDGVVMDDFYLMNPGEIESIEVLKDASSAAIYGARGANGVIMVTTKRGVRGGGTRVSYEGSVAISNPQRYMETLDAYEWVEAFKIGLDNAAKWQGFTGSTDVSTYLNNPDLFNSDGSPKYNTDWQREATRTAISHTHQLSIQQGGERSSIGAFLNYADNQGVVNNTFSKRVSARMAWDAQPLDWLSTSVNLSVNHVMSRVTPESGGGQDARRTMIEMVPWMPVRDKNGVYTNSSTGASGETVLPLGLEGMANPVSILDLQKRMRYNTAIRGNASLTFHLAEGLDLLQQFGIDNTDLTEKYHSSNTLLNISAPTGDAWRDYSTRYNWEEKVYLTWNGEFGDHRVNAMAGTEWSRNTYDRARMQSRGLDDFWEWYNMGVGTDQRPNGSGWNQSSMHSVFARAAWNYKNLYSATVTARYDGSSKFGANNKYAFFPSAGLAWNISNEEFMADATAISNLKLHTSYGVTGNSSISPYSSFARIDSGTTLIDGTRQPSARIGSLSNPDLKWEKTGMWDIGVELGLFRSRLNFDVSFYAKNTTDLLLSAPIPQSSGFGSIMMNIGAVKNTGVDVMITGIPVQTDNFNWSSSLNFNYNKNEVTKLANNNADIEQLSWVDGPKQIIRVGEDMNSFYGYVREGVWTVEDAAAGLCEQKQIGRAKRATTRTILGKGTPDITGSFINNLSYKNFDLSVDFQFVLGVETMQQFYHSTYDRFGITNGLKRILYDAYDGTNPDAMQQAIYLTGNAKAGGVGHSSEGDTSWVVDGSYLRLNQVMLGYTIPANVCQSMGVSQLRVYVSGNNLFLLTSKKFDGYDPESSSQISESGSSVSYNKFGQNMAFFSYPRARTFMAGLQLTF